MLFASCNDLIIHPSHTKTVAVGMWSLAFLILCHVWSRLTVKTIKEESWSRACVLVQEMVCSLLARVHCRFAVGCMMQAVENQTDFHRYFWHDGQSLSWTLLTTNSVQSQKLLLNRQKVECCNRINRIFKENRTKKTNNNLRRSTSSRYKLQERSRYFRKSS